MIGIVNCVLGGVLVALALIFGAHIGALPAQATGAAAGALLLVSTLSYERRRIRAASSESAAVTDTGASRS